MIFSAHRLRPMQVFQAAAWMAAAALALSACDGRIAGTSVGTGNPTEIQLGFRDSSGAPVPVTGSLQVYASTQIPVPGFSPQPLLTVDVAGAPSASLKAEAFQALADSLWPKGSVENGVYAFNLVVAGQERGAILKGFEFRKDGSRFVLPDADSGAARLGDAVRIDRIVSPLTDIEGVIDTNSLSSTWDNYLFLYGTGYAAKSMSGKFVFHGLPETSHQAFLISLPHKDDPIGTSIDSLFIYGVSTDITSGSVNALKVGDVQSAVPNPQSIKTK
ncbi:MAG: hypothetical protein JF616_22405 [Fibrobacteres bacterium]|jgi:hypothetical protein|nr:hypothetical protein [Fibrobacterota bacterium]